MARQKTVERQVTQADLDANPDLVTQGVEIGTVMKLPVIESETKEVEEKGSSKKVTFQIHNPNNKEHHSTRIFDQETHGKDYSKIADQFEETNKEKIISRSDE